MDLIKIDIVGVKSFQRCIDSVEDSLTGKTTLVDIVDCLIDVFQCKHLRFVALASRSTAFCTYDELVPWYIVFLDSFTYNLFGSTVAVYVGSIPSV